MPFAPLPVSGVRALCIAALAASMSSGCQYEDFDQFANRASRLQCKRQRHCDRKDFHKVYGRTLRECRDDLEDQWYEKLDQFEQMDCRYDPEVGKRCIERMYERRRDCAWETDVTISDSCREVFTCFSPS